MDHNYIAKLQRSMVALARLTNAPGGGAATGLRPARRAQVRAVCRA
ncbi:hypothetical protein FHY16_000468 [Xanthomonas campestris]|nr:hypothetical protein [Xanthomonas euroxanthea]MBB3777747.1 hypothetical protein [Xanthomonas euroxanthea]